MTADLFLLHKHKGARNELAATVWLLDQGYEVFRNISQHGAVDIIATRNGEIVFIDVKARHPSSTGAVGARATEEQYERGVKFLYINAATGEISLGDPLPPFVTAPCDLCGNLFTQKRSEQRYCSRNCRERAKYHSRRSG